VVPKCASRPGQPSKAATQILSFAFGAMAWVRLFLARALLTGRLPEAGNGFGFIVVNVKDGQQLGDLQQILDLLGEVQQF
jgi:hypothetical protein